MANVYGLTRDMADAIVKAVRDDPECRELLPSISAFKFFSPIGHAGTARNLFNFGAMNFASDVGFVLGHAGSPNLRKEIVDANTRIGDVQACTGIAAATARVLTRIAGTPGYEFLISAGPVDRMPSDPPHDYHTATAVTVTDDKSYVFDWHSTLYIGDPLIFNSITAFKAGFRPIRYTHFWGLS